MKFPRQVRTFRGSFDFAPFAGVFFLFIIFALLQSSVVYQPGVKINLPQADALPGVEGPVLVAAVDASGQIFYDNQVTDEATLQKSLRSELRKIGQPTTLIIQADQNVPYAKILHLSTLAREAGVHKALLATRPPPAVLPVNTNRP